MLSGCAIRGKLDEPPRAVVFFDPPVSVLYLDSAGVPAEAIVRAAVAEMPRFRLRATSPARERVSDPDEPIRDQIARFCRLGTDAGVDLVLWTNHQVEVKEESKCKNVGILAEDLQCRTVGWYARAELRLHGVRSTDCQPVGTPVFIAKTASRDVAEDDQRARAELLRQVEARLAEQVIPDIREKLAHYVPTRAVADRTDGYRAVIPLEAGTVSRGTLYTVHREDVEIGKAMVASSDGRAITLEAIDETPPLAPGDTFKEIGRPFIIEMAGALALHALRLDGDAALAGTIGAVIRYRPSGHGVTAAVEFGGGAGGNGTFLHGALGAGYSVDVVPRWLSLHAGLELGFAALGQPIDGSDELAFGTVGLASVIAGARVRPRRKWFLTVEAGYQRSSAIDSWKQAGEPVPDSSLEFLQAEIRGPMARISTYYLFN